jgi:hypothetical protein
MKAIGLVIVVLLAVIAFQLAGIRQDAADQYQPPDYGDCVFNPPDDGFYHANPCIPIYHPN